MHTSHWNFSLSPTEVKQDTKQNKTKQTSGKTTQADWVLLFSSNVTFSSSNAPSSSSNVTFSSNNVPLSSINVTFSSNNVPLSSNNVLLSYNYTPSSFDNVPFKSMWKYLNVFHGKLFNDFYRRDRSLIF